MRTDKRNYASNDNQESKINCPDSEASHSWHFQTETLPVDLIVVRLNLPIMTKDTPDLPPQKPAQAGPAKAARQEREAAALRANLRKRKDQARERSAAQEPRKPEEP